MPELLRPARAERLRVEPPRTDRPRADRPRAGRPRTESVRPEPARPDADREARVEWRPGAAEPDVDATLAAAEEAPTPAQRFVLAHTAALQVAALVLARRRAKVSGRPGVWSILARVAPELGEWAAYFDALALKRRAVEAGAVGLVTGREADDLIRDAHAFARAAGVRVAAHG